MKKENQISKDRFTVILEDVNSKLDGLAEGHSNLNEKVDNLNEKVDRNHQEFVEFREEMNGFKSETKSNFQTVFNLFVNIDDDIKDIKA